jgi:hypothetical protein
VQNQPPGGLFQWLVAVFEWPQIPAIAVLTYVRTSLVYMKKTMPPKSMLLPSTDDKMKY